MKNHEDIPFLKQDLLFKKSRKISIFNFEIHRLRFYAKGTRKITHMALEICYIISFQKGIIFYNPFFYPLPESGKMINCRTKVHFLKRLRETFVSGHWSAFSFGYCQIQPSIIVFASGSIKIWHTIMKS